MTRPKVPPERRQRTAQACESCKRRKQKCNGLCPCNTCEKRKFTCTYADRDPTSSGEGKPAAKRRAVDGDDSESPRVKDTSTEDVPSNDLDHASPSPAARRRSLIAHDPVVTPQEVHLTDLNPEPSFKSFAGAPQPTIELTGNAAQQLPTSYANRDHHLPSRGTTVNSGPDEEAVIYSQSRMLQDPTGRVLYIGDSATLSFLQLLRMMVETVAGPSQFTNDPNRHMIVEGQFSLPSGYRHTHLLPDLETARVLADSFFVNTHGLLQIFERDRYMDDLNKCYTDPLSTETPWLCLLNLVFAIGLTMATPLSGSPEALIVNKLRSEHLDRAEVFYLNAKGLNDPINGLEDQDFWAVQALLLMSVYMLAKSKRNAAFALLGMAARSAHALGLHREETMVIFGAEVQISRRNLWRSIFVMDRFMSCSMGRPTAISEDDCSGDTLDPAFQNVDQTFTVHLSVMADYNETEPHALEAAVRSCSVIGRILRKVYQQRKISTRLAQEIADVCKAWPRALPSILHWRQAANASPSQGVAILHVNLFYCHSIILLTRPFFLYILNLETQRQIGQTATRGPRPYLRMEKFSEACVIASTHTILLVQNAFEAGYLSRRNPAVIYFLFAATLVILANEFAGLYRVDASDTCIVNGVNIMNYCAESDQQASRLVYILSAFREVVTEQRNRRKQGATDNSTLPSISTQLYGVPLANHAPQSSSNVAGMASAAIPTTTTSRLYQVPIHIYPGMETAPMNTATPTFEQQPQLPSHPEQTSQTSHDFSVHLTPIQNPITSAGENDVFNTSADPLTMPSRPLSLSALLELSALESTRVPSLHSEESGLDEQIDFDALWAWPNNTPAMGTPRMDAQPGGADRTHSTSNNSVVPLFGIGRDGQG